MRPALVSIVIPAYNAGVYLDRTLYTAMRQTYPHLEIIVVNDGSTDDTREIAERAAAIDPRIRVLHIPNGGVANARNVGTAEAAGEYVAFLDADDLWHPTKVELQMKAVTTPIDGVLPVASYALMRLIDGENRVIGSSNAIAMSGYALARHIRLKPVGNGSSILVRRSVVQELGGYDPSWVARGIGGCEDLDFELKIVAKYVMVGVPLFLVGYRRYPGNMSSQHLKMAAGAIAVIEQHIKANPELPRWVAREARSSILVYALELLECGRHWRAAGRVAGRLCRVTPTFGTKVVYRKSRVWVNKKLGLGRVRPGEDIRPEHLQPFDEYDPASGVTIATESDGAFINRLALVDKRLETHKLAKPMLPWARSPKHSAEAVWP